MNDKRYADLSDAERLVVAVFHDHTVGDLPDSWYVGVALADAQPNRLYGPFEDRPEAEVHAQQIRDDFMGDPVLTGSVITVIPAYRPYE